jgi:hypothetical protein
MLIIVTPGGIEKFYEETFDPVVKGNRRHRSARR